MAKKNVFNNYEILKPGARIKKGDQFYSSDSRGWFNAEPPDIGLTVSQYGGLRVRRPKPQPKYYFLKAGELIREGDSWTAEYGSQKSNCWPAGCFGERLLEANVGYCRRLIKKGK